MSEWMYAVILILVWSCGYVTGRNIKRNTHPPNDQQEIMVKRVRPSFRNPARRTVTVYDKYKTSEGMYAPIRPGKGSTADDKEIQ